MRAGRTSPWRRAAAVSGGAFALGTVAMVRWERQMRATGGPGILALELAPSALAVRTILESWGEEGRRAAVEETWADFAYMQTYGVMGTSLVELARQGAAPGSRWERSGRVVRWLPAAAVVCDALEGFGMLRNLTAPAPTDRWARATSAAASTKFALLTAAALWAAGAATAGRRR